MVWSRTNQILILTGTLVLLCLALVNCSAGYPRGEGSLLILTVPSFRTDDLSCSQDSLTPNIAKICNEGVRFTHAYTPSTLSNPALASLLTGLYPSEHGVRDNGPSIYKDGVKSLSQFGKEQKMVTIFVSGGVPALRKAAISKGFDDFDDSVRTHWDFYRPASDSVKSFLSLLQDRVRGLPFLGLIQFADLMFPDVISTQAVQETMEGHHKGKLQEVDRALGILRDHFVKQKIWDPMTVVLVGLKGLDRIERDGLAGGVLLYDELVRVPMVIKPGRKLRDKGPSWKIDAPVSLVDLGVTLMSLVEADSPNESGFPTMNFVDVLEKGEAQFEPRPIFSENTLPQIRGWGPTLFSVRKNEWVYWPKPEQRLFNTYTDRFQLHNLLEKDSATAFKLELVWRKHKELLKNDKDAQNNLPVSIGEKLRIAALAFSGSISDKEKSRVLNVLEIRRPLDWQVRQWQVRQLLRSKNWGDLFRMLRKVKPQDKNQSRELQLWKAFAHLKMRLKDPVPFREKLSGCLELANSLGRFSKREIKRMVLKQMCRDLETDYWVRAYLNHKVKNFEEAADLFVLARDLTSKRVEQDRFSALFWVAGATWDYNTAFPSGPGPFEFFVSLSSDSKFKEFISRKRYF